jgi:hypothetical protein
VRLKGRGGECIFASASPNAARLMKHAVKYELSELAFCHSTRTDPPHPINKEASVYVCFFVLCSVLVDFLHGTLTLRKIDEFQFNSTDSITFTCFY